ncbi:hypothetical protein CN072_24370 [Sinorhizobium meliloti]|nr:hypothetical protein CN218_22885 [Sinorhizobium meliloti]RVP81360.1 hypothetical protein CN072_24370 [Sinorhizobium meliloti]
MIEASFRSPPLRRWRRAVANMIADVVACGIVSRASSDIIAIGALRCAGKLRRPSPGAAGELS